MIVAVDTGGTKTLVAIFDADGSITASHKFPTPEAIEDYLSELTATIDRLIDPTEITYISAALPGTIENGVMVDAGNLTRWITIDLPALLSERYSCPIYIENDANLAGLAEARALSPVPRMCLYVTVSTGVGTGIITGGQIDPNFATTEGGSILLEHEGKFMRWEHMASGKAIVNKYGKQASEIEDEATWREIALNIARGLLALIPALRPDVIVIGGGVGTHFDKYAVYLNETLQANFKKEKYLPQIVKATHPEEAVIYGCYYHALDQSAS